MAAFSLCCPKCKANLKMAARPAEGKKVKCPKCAAVFVAADKEASDNSTAIKPASNRPVVPAAAKGRPSREDDDADDAPRSRKSRADSDDADDAKPRRRRKKIRKSNTGLIVGLSVGGTLLLVLTLAAGGFFLFRLLDKPQPVPVAKGPQVNPAAAPVANNPQVNAPGNAKPGRPPAGPGPNARRPGNPFNRRTKRNPQSPQPQPQAQPQPQPELQPVAGPVDLDEKLLAKTSRATVFVRVDLGSQTATGSGFLVKSVGDTAYVITNFHVIDLEEKAAPNPANNRGGMRMGRRRFPFPRMAFPRGPRGFMRRGLPGRSPAPKPKERPKVTVVLNSGTPDEQAASAEVVATDAESDLAALRITGARNLPPALDVSQEPFVAEQQPVYIFGFPANKRPAGPNNPPVTVGKGTIAGLRRNANNELIDVHINGDLNPGNSGGPVIDAEGHLVGIAVAAVLGKQIGFAIPAGILQQMFKGRLSNGLVVHLKQFGPRVDLIGEVWLHDHQGSVRARKVVSANMGAAPRGTRLPANEYLVLARLADPMLKIKGVKAHVAATEKVPEQPGEQGWAKLAKAVPVSLKIEDQMAIGTYKLPRGVVADQMFAFQFSYVNADNKTIFTQPHLVRLTFPQNSLSVTLNISGIPDEPTRRYIQDMGAKLLPGNGKVRTVSWSKDKLVMELDPVPDPSVLKAKIAFGEVASVQGRTFAVKAKKLDLPPPSDADVISALEDLKSSNKQQRIKAADKLAKVYVILPPRRAEVAKALGPLAADKDIWVAKPALRALQLWGGPENIADVLPALDNVFTIDEAVKVLAQFKDASVADALAKLLAKGGRERGAAGAALKQMGPIAEKAVIPFVNNTTFWCAMEACNVLKEIGTAQCIPVLTQAVNNPKFPAKMAAQGALKSVRARTKQAARR